MTEFEIYDNLKTKYDELVEENNETQSELEELRESLWEKNNLICKIQNVCVCVISLSLISMVSEIINHKT
jgi:regulator of replication initiation timing